MKNFGYGQIWLMNFDPSFGSEYKKSQQISSFDKGRFIKFIGEIKFETMKEAREHIRRFLNL